MSFYGSFNLLNGIEYEVKPAICDTVKDEVNICGYPEFGQIVCLLWPMIVPR